MLASAFMAAPSIWCHARGVIRDAGVASAIRRGAHSISVEEEKKKKGKKFECMKRPPVVFWARLWYGWLNWHRGVISPSSILISFSFSLLVLFFFHPSSASFYLLFYVFKVTCSVMALSYWNTAVWCSQKQPCTTGRSQSDGDDEKRRPLQSGNKSFASFNAGYILIYLCARKKRGASSSLAPLFSLTHSLFFSST